MIKQFAGLTENDQELLFKAPVLVSVLAACPSGEVNEARKNDAIQLAHLKTFAANPLLQPYYAQVEKKFKTQFEAVLSAYLPFDDIKRNEIKKELEKVNEVIGLLDENYAQALRKSLEQYSIHVKRGSHSMLEDFIFPIPIPGLSD